MSRFAVNQVHPIPGILEYYGIVPRAPADASVTPVQLQKEAERPGVTPPGTEELADDAANAVSDGASPPTPEEDGALERDEATVQGAGGPEGDLAATHAAAAQGIADSGTTLPHLTEIQRSFGPKHDLSGVQAHVGGPAAQANEEMGALAYTRGRHVAFREAPDLRLAAHEAAHVVQQRAGVQLKRGVGDIGDVYEQNADAVAERVVQGRSAVDLLPDSGSHTGADALVQRAVPAAIIWSAKAVAATTFDAFIDFAIAAILGLPAPGALDHVGNFLTNLVPFLGEAKKAKKVAKLLKLVGKIVEPIQKMKALKTPGAGKLMERLIREAGKLKDELRRLDLDAARQTFSRLLGYVREAQVATKLRSQGAVIEHLGKTIKAGGKQLTDIDVVAREGGQLVLHQVKAGNAAKLTPGSTSWAQFTKQAERTKEAAEQLKDAHSVLPKVRYVVDDITPEARHFLEGLGFEVKVGGEFLK